jgi:hypothetical protein
VLELKSPEPVANPLVEVGELSGGFRRPEVSPPAEQEAPKFAITSSMLRPVIRLVIRRTRSFIAVRVFGATRSFTFPPLATQKLKPRNFRSNGEPTALFASFTRSRSFAYSRRMVRAASRPETVAVFGEGRVEDRRQDVEDGLLDEPVEDAGDPELSGPSAALRYLLPSHRLRAVRSRE